MITHVFINQYGKISYELKYFINYSKLVEREKAFTKEFNIFFDNIFEINCTVYFCNNINSINLCFKEFNGPILLYKPSGFIVEELNYLKKRMLIAIGKLICVH